MNPGGQAGSGSGDMKPLSRDDSKPNVRVTPVSIAIPHQYAADGSRAGFPVMPKVVLMPPIPPSMRTNLNRLIAPNPTPITVCTTSSGSLVSTVHAQPQQTVPPKATVSSIGAISEGKMVTGCATVVPVNTTLSTPLVGMVNTASIASIMKSTTHQSHISTPPTSVFSSHVPRGPAAVAAMTAPKSAVATPVLRPSHSTNSQVSVTSTTSSLHPQIQPRTTVLPSSRTISQSLSGTALSSLTTTHHADIARNVNHTSALTGSTVQMTLQTASRTAEVSVRTLTSSKPVHASSPIIQQSQPLSQKMVSQATVAPVPQQTPVVSSTKVKPVSFTVGTSHSSPLHTVMPNSNISKVTSSASVTVPTTIPVAKVYPQQVPISSRNPLDLSSESGNMYLPVGQRNSPNPANTGVTLPSSVVLSDSLTERSSLQPTPYAMSYFYEPYPMAPFVGTPHTSHFNPISTTTSLRSMTWIQAPVECNVTSASTTSVHTTVVTSSSMTANAPSHASSQTIVPNLSTSPRPSILRKRANEGINIVVKKPLTALSVGEIPSPQTDSSSSQSAASSPKLPSDSSSKENGFIGAADSTSENTAIVAPISNANITLAVQTVVLPSINIKQEPTDNSEPASPAVSRSITNAIEASPRKKPRKQQLLNLCRAANELIETHTTDEEDQDQAGKENAHKDIKKEEEKVRLVGVFKRPHISLLSTYRYSWKSRHNHFLRYSDVKTKDERRPTVNELANQKGVLQRANGWKIFHLGTQLDDLVSLEDEVYKRLSGIQEELKPRPGHKSHNENVTLLQELIKGNLQRCKIIKDQMLEAKQQMLKIFEHKQQVVTILGKYTSKRPLKKKDKC